MNVLTKFAAAAALLAAPALLTSTAVHAGVGDLLVAPTRIVLDGRKGAEIILNNIGEEPATYRISMEFRRMLPNGTLEDVAEITDAPASVNLGPDGNSDGVTFGIGGSIDVTDSTADGLYQGTFAVTAEYE